MQPSQLIDRDAEILGGTPVFKGTRVPVEVLFDHLEQGIPLAEFLDDYPTVTRAHAIAVLELAGKLVITNSEA